MNYRELLRAARERLAQSGIDTASHDAMLLMQHLTGRDRSFFITNADDVPSDEVAAAYNRMIETRSARVPLQYITGSQEFMGLEFKVDCNVLIPRQDTETLVETAIAFYRNKNAECRFEADLELKDERSGNTFNVLDMCTGSGAIAVSCAYYMPEAKVTASDISIHALKIAAENASKYDLSKRITFVQSDLFENLTGMHFDMILCNPPYISSAVIETLQSEVKDHEPRTALDGGSDGLEFYKKIARDAHPHLKRSGLLILEIGYDQATQVVGLLNQTAVYKEINVIKDLAGMDRVVTAKKE